MCHHELSSQAVCANLCGTCGAPRDACWSDKFAGTDLPLLDFALLDKLYCLLCFVPIWVFLMSCSLGCCLVWRDVTLRGTNSNLLTPVRLDPLDAALATSSGIFSRFKCRSRGFWKEENVVFPPFSARLGQFGVLETLEASQTQPGHISLCVVSPALSHVYSCTRQQPYVRPPSERKRFGNGNGKQSSQSRFLQTCCMPMLRRA